MAKITARFPNLKVLLVEDYFINQEVTVDMLEMLDCQADVAEDGHTAVKMATENKYDLIIMDLQIPGIDGLEATKQIRAVEKGVNPAIIIALTASAMQGDMEKCLSSGMDDYMSKPMEFNTLEGKIRKFFSNRMVLAT
jgi:two-component system sensor histidine kinase/response regulator